ncbi:uncharacterized protein LOC123004024 [Tribolium madens]|uniref:uncharacterized protein LOC123004024 n=1 Tax=Tribolium madens TaxID=41895 RepID=UPI001CF72E7B|nr:uncharacterized protein LOC123004024 [Tribolium madens]
MKCAAFLTCLLTTIQIGHALNCYKCNGCETAKNMKETCRNVDPATQISACLTQKIHVGGTPEPMTIKKCTVYGKTEKFTCPTLPEIDTLSCQICHEDFCNSGMALRINLYLMFFAIFLALKFL